MKMEKLLRKLFLNFQLKPQVIQLRCCSTSIIDKIPEDSSSVYSSTSTDYKKGKKFAVVRIQELFKLHHTEAIETAMRFKKIHKVMNKILSDNYHLLKSYNISDDVILKYLDMLAEKDVLEKLKLLKQLPYDLNITVPMLLLRFTQVHYFVKRQLSGEKRISFLCSLFQVTVPELTESFVKRQFLLNICLNKVEKNFQILMDNGISLDELHNDYWVLQYNYDIIKERLEMAKTRNIGKVKTWMVRSPIEVLDRYGQRRNDNKEILGDGTLIEYLSDRLQCTLESAKIILLKHPALSNKHMKKIKEIIDFLLDYGFTPLHVVRHPKILLHSVETTAKRLKELKSEGLKLDSLYILTKSQREYLNYYENLVKGNKNKVKECV